MNSSYSSDEMVPSITVVNNLLLCLAYLIQQQSDATAMDLSKNYRLFMVGFAGKEYRSSDEIQVFFGSIASHPSLQKLILRNVQFHGEAFTALLLAAERNANLSTIVLSPDCIPNVSSVWLKILPRLKNLKCFVGLQGVLEQPAVVSALQKNASLIELKKDIDAEDEESGHLQNRKVESILERNKLLLQTEKYTKTKSLPLCVMAHAMKRLASKNVEPSALYHFMCWHAEKIPQPDLLRQHKQAFWKKPTYEKESTNCTDQLCRLQ